MSTKKKWAVGSAVAGISAILVAFAIGAWNVESPHYWRRHTQHLLLDAAESLPAGKTFRKAVIRLTEAALRVHPPVSSRRELMRAARLLEGAGEPAAAATLWLGVTNLDFRRRDVNSARVHAIRSLQAFRTVEALASLVILTPPGHGLEAKWVRELQAVAPLHDLVIAARCRDAVGTFTTNPPEVCGATTWVNEIAWYGRREDIRIAREIKELPAKAAREIASHKARVDRLSAEQLDLEITYQKLSGDLHGLGWLAAGEVLIDVSPLPKEGDSLEDYLVREGVCGLPVIIWICGLGAVGEAMKRMDTRKARINDRMSNIAELHRLNESLMGYSREQIDYWRSSRPIELLAAERTALVEQFRIRIKEESHRRYPEPGMPVSAAVDAVLMRPNVGQHRN